MHRHASPDAVLAGIGFSTITISINPSNTKMHYIFIIGHCVLWNTIIRASRDQQWISLIQVVCIKRGLFMV